MECDVVDGRRPLSGVMCGVCVYFHGIFQFLYLTRIKNSLWTCGCVRRSILLWQNAAVSLRACRRPADGGRCRRWESVGKKMWNKFIVERRQIATCHIPLNSVRGTERCQMIEYERNNYTESICLWLKKIKMNSSTKRWTGWKQRQTENCRKTNNKLLAASVAVCLCSVSHHAAEYGAAAANTMFAHDVIQNKLRRALANETSVRLHLIYRWIVWLDRWLDVAWAA